MSQAWLLDLGAGYRAAVGGRELVHLLYAPPRYEVPKTPPHGRNVVRWQDRLLPVLDLAQWFGAESGVAQHQVAGVFAYQHRRGEAPHYGALWLTVPPVRLSVERAQACALAEPVSAWQAVACSCFEHEGAPVPVLDLHRLYTRVLTSD